MSANTKPKLFLFEWNKETAAQRAQELTATGWQVETEYEEGSRGCRNCKAFAPDVVVLDLAAKPSHSREVGRALRKSKATRDLPFVFVDGTEDDIAKAWSKVPDALFAPSKALKKLLSKLAPGKIEV